MPTERVSPWKALEQCGTRQLSGRGREIIFYYAIEALLALVRRKLQLHCQYYFLFNGAVEHDRNGLNAVSNHSRHRLQTTLIKF